MAVHGNPVKMDQPVRAHVFGKMLLKSLEDGFILIFTALIEKDDLSGSCIINAAAVFYKRKRLKDRLDLTELNAVAHMLDLRIPAGSEVKQSVLVKPAHISGAVELFWEIRVQGILDEGFFSVLRVVVVAGSQRGTADADLACFAGGGFRSLFCKKKDLSIRERLSDGKGFKFGKLPVHNIVSTVAGDLCRTVKVDVHGFRQMFSPVGEHFHGHDFTGKQDFPKRSLHSFVQNLQGGKNT